MIKVQGQDQIQITHPPKGYGDYHPNASANKLTWIRKKDIADSKDDLWIADQNGKNAKAWIKNIDGYDLFEK